MMTMMMTMLMMKFEAAVSRCPLAAAADLLL